MPDETIKLIGRTGLSFELNASDVARLMEQHADEALRKATLPATPADYKIELPPTQAAGRVEMKLNPADPAFEAARNGRTRRV